MFSVSWKVCFSTFLLYLYFQWRFVMLIFVLWFYNWYMHSVQNNSRWLKITNESHKQKKITINIWCYFYFAPSENFYVSYIMLVLEKEMAVHSSILAWAIPWREERGRLQSVLSHFSHIFLFATPWTVVWQVPLTMGFSRQEYWSGLPFPFPGNLPHPGI